MTTRRQILARAAASAACLAAAAVLPGCVQGEAPSTGGKLRVAATTTMVADLVKRVGGDRVAVKAVMGPGVDPHTFKPSTGDVAELDAAAIVFYNGLHLEGKMVDLFEQQMRGKAFPVAAAVPKDKLLGWAADGGGGEGGGTHDPHVWFDVGLWRAAVPYVRDRLKEKDPAGAAAYGANAAAFEASLAALDAEVRQKLASVPKPQRVLITSHDAYSYFGKAYDVEVRGVQGISTETEAGLNDVSQAVQFIVGRKIKAVFVETSVNKGTIERVVDDSAKRGWPVRQGGELYSDAMGAPGERPGYAVETYEGMVRYNVDTIVNALK